MCIILLCIRVKQIPRKAKSSFKYFYFDCLIDKDNKTGRVRSRIRPSTTPTRCKMQRIVQIETNKNTYSSRFNEI